MEDSRSDLRSSILDLRLITMKCPFCHETENRVIDSRLSKDSNMIRRRRECERCTRRFTTYERVEEMMPLVVKKDGRRESYDRVKIINGLKRACEKRPVSINTIEAIADRIERTLQERGEKEIASSVIGEALMRELHDTDPVAYVRFASVYRSFKDISEFMVELEELIKERKGVPLARPPRLRQKKGIASLAGAHAGALKTNDICAWLAAWRAKAAGRTSPNPHGRRRARARRENCRHRLSPLRRRRSRGNRRAQAAPAQRRRGATLYITLEPCSHQGRTPPCTGALIRAGIKEVVVRHEGSQSAGCRTRLSPAAPRRHRGARRLAGRRMPRADRSLCQIHHARAAVRDAQIGRDTRRQDRHGERRCALDQRRRVARTVHRLRNEVDAVVVGLGTVEADDPQLTCRIAGGRNPWRVVLDSRLGIAAFSGRSFTSAIAEKTIVVDRHRRVSQQNRARSKRWARRSGACRLQGTRGGLAAAAEETGAASGIVSVMIEGGAAVAASALKEKIVDKICFFYAPKILGGDGRPMIDGLGIQPRATSPSVKELASSRSGERSCSDTAIL